MAINLYHSIAALLCHLVFVCANEASPTLPAGTREDRMESDTEGPPVFPEDTTSSVPTANQDVESGSLAQAEEVHVYSKGSSFDMLSGTDDLIDQI